MMELPSMSCSGRGRPLRDGASPLNSVSDRHIGCPVMTSEPAADRPTLASLTVASLPYLTLLGCAGLVANVTLSFEEPHDGVLFVSALLLAAAPIGLVVHLAITDELTPDEKRNWVAGLMSRKGPKLFGAYWPCVGRRHAGDRWCAFDHLQQER
jgi:hypothetical protein